MVRAFRIVPDNLRTQGVAYLIPVLDSITHTSLKVGHMDFVVTYFDLNNAKLQVVILPIEKFDGERRLKRHLALCGDGNAEFGGLTVVRP